MDKTKIRIMTRQKLEQGQDKNLNRDKTKIRIGTRIKAEQGQDKKLEIGQDKNLGQNGTENIKKGFKSLNGTVMNKGTQVGLKKSQKVEEKT